MVDKRDASSGFDGLVLLPSEDGPSEQGWLDAQMKAFIPTRRNSEIIIERERTMIIDLKDELSNEFLENPMIIYGLFRHIVDYMLQYVFFS